MIMAYDMTQNKYFRLTRGYYYIASGIKARNKKATLRNLELKGINDSLNKTTTKTIEDKEWYIYQQVIIRNYNRLWSFKTTRKIKKEDFRITMIKERCLDLFFNKFLIKGEKKPVVAYGGASIAPTGKGELTVSIKYIYNKCSNRFNGPSKLISKN